MVHASNELYPASKKPQFLFLNASQTEFSKSLTMELVRGGSRSSSRASRSSYRSSSKVARRSYASRRAYPSTRTYSRGGRSTGCGSRGGPGYRDSTGRCTSWARSSRSVATKPRQTPAPNHKAQRSPVPCQTVTGPGFVNINGVCIVLPKKLGQ
jgi:hypothetical protein